jgi:ribose transport system permease protein
VSDTSTAAPPTATPPRAKRPTLGQATDALRSISGSTALWVFMIDIILVIVFGLLSPEHAFLTTRSFQSLGFDAAEALILATGIALLLGAAEIDLSLGANLLLSSVIGGKVISSFGGSYPGWAAALGVVVCMATGATIGLVNGLIITRLRVVSLIATLATLGIATGIANIVTDGTDITGLPQSLQTDFGIKTIAQVPLPAVVAFVIWLVTLILFKTTRYGMRILAMGSNRAAVIGGTSLFGGRVSLAGVLSGTLLAVILEDGLIVVGLSPFYQLIAIGVVLIAAVSLDQRRRPSGIRLRR